MVLLPASLFVLLSLLTGAAEQENCLEDASQHWQQHHNEQQHCIDKFDEQHRDSLGSSSACAAWADAGECENNAGFMVGHCTKSCNLCAILRNYSARCPAAPNRTPAVVPGQMTSTFERALRPEFSHLNRGCSPVNRGCWHSTAFCSHQRLSHSCATARAATNALQLLNSGKVMASPRSSLKFGPVPRRGVEMLARTTRISDAFTSGSPMSHASQQPISNCCSFSNMKVAPVLAT